jgi:hypothetical protein
MALSEVERIYKREYRLRRIAADPSYLDRENTYARLSARRRRATGGEAFMAKQRKADVLRNASQERKDYMSDRDLRKRYNITLAEKRAMFSRQQGRCAIPSCASSFASLSDAKVDHDHSTGRVRGLLCSACNVTLGHGREKPAVLRDLAAYLELYANA